MQILFFNYYFAAVSKTVSHRKCLIFNFLITGKPVSNSYCQMYLFFPTKIGSRRCHQQPPNLCLIPSLGSGPDPTHPGSGFYTKDDYREILMYANNRHVQVIPEIDMPGHAR